MLLLRAAANPKGQGKKQMNGPKKRFTAAMNPDYSRSYPFCMPIPVYHRHDNIDTMKCTPTFYIFYFYACTTCARIPA
jgi:hypothetical protein